jgi:hypothetical protein
LPLQVRKITCVKEEKCTHNMLHHPFPFHLTNVIFIMSMMLFSWTLVFQSGLLLSKKLSSCTLACAQDYVSTKGNTTEEEKKQSKSG